MAEEGACGDGARPAGVSVAAGERADGARGDGARPAGSSGAGERSEKARGGGGGGLGVVHVQEHHDVEEVKARLFAAPDLGAVRAEVGSLWSWVSNKGSALASDLAPLGGKLATLGETALSEAERLSKNVIEAAGSLPQLSGAEAGVAGAGGGEDGDVGGGEAGEGAGAAGTAAQAMPPWIDPQYAPFVDAIRTRVLELSADRETFLVAPPPGAAVADVGAAAKRALMSADAQVEEMRLVLVPGQVDERAFWRNYMYRVSLVLAAYAPSEDAAQAAAPPAAPSEAALGVPDKQASPSWNDDGLDLGEDNLENFDMLDDDELLASTGLQQTEESDEDEESAAALEERIKAELNLS
jgi:hypothetical protein